MSGEKKQDLSGNEHDSDDEQIENTAIDLDKKAQVSHSSSGATNHNLLDYTDMNTTEVDPNDILTIQEVSHESGQSSSENLGCTVIYEFPNDDEIENVSHSCEACSNNVNGIPCNKKPVISDHSEFLTVPILQVNENYKKKLVDTKAVNKDDFHVAENSGETERKRKILPSSSQNKRHKEMQNPSISIFELPCQSKEDIVQVERLDFTSEDEFADVEDNAKDSSSSDNNESDSTSKTVKEILKDLAADIQLSMGCKTESSDASKSLETSINCCSQFQNSQSSSKSVDKNVEKPFLTSSKKAETVPEIDFSNISKNKFQLPMTTIFEIPESESDEQISQPMQSKTNPLKMKTSVVKRKDRCNICNVRIGLCAIKCRCGGYYCAKHRYDNEHGCTFDYKSMGAEEIRKNNPRVTAEKVRKL